MLHFVQHDIGRAFSTPSVRGGVVPLRDKHGLQCGTIAINEYGETKKRIRTQYIRLFVVNSLTAAFQQLAPRLNYICSWGFLRARR